MHGYVASCMTTLGEAPLSVRFDRKRIAGHILYGFQGRRPPLVTRSTAYPFSP